MDDWWSDPLRSLVGGRLVVVAGASAAVWSDHVSVLRDAGATDILVVANAWGAGPAPDATTVVVEAPSGLSTMEQIRSDNRFLADPPIEVVQALDEAVGASATIDRGAGTVWACRRA